MGVIFYKYFCTMSRTMCYPLCPRTVIGEMYCYRLIKKQNEIWDFHEDACEK
jgi:polyferredoxin